MTVTYFDERIGMVSEATKEHERAIEWDTGYARPLTEYPRNTLRIVHIPPDVLAKIAEVAK
jgi:hypothetical protein